MFTAKVYNHTCMIHVYVYLILFLYSGGFQIGCFFCLFILPIFQVDFQIQCVENYHKNLEITSKDLLSALFMLFHLIDSCTNSSNLLSLIIFS